MTRGQSMRWTIDRAIESKKVTSKNSYNWLTPTPVDDSATFSYGCHAPKTVLYCEERLCFMAAQDSLPVTLSYISGLRLLSTNVPGCSEETHFILVGDLVRRTTRYTISSTRASLHRQGSWRASCGPVEWSFTPPFVFGLLLVFVTPSTPLPGRSTTAAVDVKQLTDKFSTTGTDPAPPWAVAKYRASCIRTLRCTHCSRNVLRSHFSSRRCRLPSAPLLSEARGLCCHASVGHAAQAPSCVSQAVCV